MKDTTILLDYDFELSDINEEKFDYKYSVVIAKSNVEEYNELPFPDYVISFNFEDDMWNLYYDKSDLVLQMNFSQFDTMYFLNKVHNVKEIKNIVKCWIASFILDVTAVTAQRAYKHLVDIVNLTNFFALDKINDMSAMLSESSNTLQNSIVWSVHNFFDFYNEIDTVNDYLSELNNFYNTNGSNPREIPSCNDCLKFAFILKDFYQKCNPQSWQYIYFYPIRIWWQLTTNIPMRPNEFVNIKRNCLKPKDNKYYLQLPRSKNKYNSKRIQIIDKIEISYSMYEMISEYINITEQYGASNALISYKAYRKLKEEHLNFFISKPQRQQDNLRRATLIKLIEEFYELIIAKPPYNLTVRNKENDSLDKIQNDRNNGIYYDIERILRPIDTRHISFIFLMLQGFHPIEIARLGGQMSVYSQEHYQRNCSLFMSDSSVVSLMRMFDLSGNFLSPIVNKFKKGKTSNKIDAKFRRRHLVTKADPKWDKVEIGHCSATIRLCETDCYDCSFWKCENLEYEKKYGVLIEWMNSKENKVQEIWRTLFNLHKDILNEELSEFNPSIQNNLSTLSNELLDLLDSLEIFKFNINNQVGVNALWLQRQESIQRIK